MGLLSALVVEGLKKGAGSAVSQAMGQSVASALGSGMYSGLSYGGGGGGASRATADAVARYQNPTAVAPVTATAPGAAGASGAGTIAGSFGWPQLAGGTTVDQVTSTAQPREGLDDAPGGAVGAALANITPTPLAGVTSTAAPPPSSGGTGAGTAVAPLANLGTDAPEVDEVTVEGERPDEQKSQFDSLLLPAGLTGLALTGALLGGGGGGGDGSNWTDKVPVRELIAGGLLGGGLLAGGGNGGSGSKDALKDIAASNKNLADRLANISDAGMQGNIGGKGTSMIRRMVRKAQASIRQRYAGMGMSGSTAETDDLNDAVSAGVEMQFKIGQDMAKTGLNAIASLTGQSAQAYLALMNAATAKDTALGNALANFAGALAR